METHPQNPADKIIVEVDVDLEDLVPGFLKRRQEDLQALKDALDAGDFEQILKLAHTLKGVGGGYGFDSISTISQQIHEAAGKQATDEIRAKLAELDDYLARVDVVFV